MVKAGKIGLLLGVVTGAVTGLLFAPEKGKELRENIAKERKAGGIGHKAIAHNMVEMADEVSDLVKEVAKSEEAKQFWERTHEAVSELTGGGVELDEWVKNAHAKADKLKDTVSEYAKEKKKYIEQAKGVAKSGVKKVKSTAKKAKATVKKVTKKAAPKMAAPKAPAKKKVTPKKPVAKKKVAPKKKV